MREEDYKPFIKPIRGYVKPIKKGEKVEVKANIYDRGCRHFIIDGLSGFCELRIPMCSCNKECKLTTSGHVIEYPRCRLKETR